MANLRRSLENAEERYGERIEAMIVGPHDSMRFGDDEGHLPDECVILSREAGLAKVDQDYNDGYGGADCFPLYAWTKSRVFYVSEYDGSTGLDWLPRHPMVCEPQFGGPFDYEPQAASKALP